MTEGAKNLDFINQLHMISQATVEQFKKSLSPTQTKDPRNTAILKLVKHIDSLRTIDSKDIKADLNKIERKTFERIFGKKGKRFDRKTINRIFTIANKKLEAFLMQQWHEEHLPERQLRYLEQLGLEKERRLKEQTGKNKKYIFKQEEDIFEKKIKNFQDTYFHSAKEDQYFPIKNLRYYKLKKEINGLKLNIHIRKDKLNKRKGFLLEMIDCDDTIAAIKNLRYFCVLENKKRNIEEVAPERLIEAKAKVVPLLKTEPVKHESLQFKLWWYQAKLMTSNENRTEILKTLQNIFDTYVEKTTHSSESKSHYSERHRKADLQEVVRSCASLVSYYHNEAILAKDVNMAQQWLENLHTLQKRMIEAKMVTSNTPLNYKNFISISLNLVDAHLFANQEQKAKQLLEETRSFYERNKEKFLNNNSKDNFIQHYADALILFYEKKYRECQIKINKLQSSYESSARKRRLADKDRINNKQKTEKEKNTEPIKQVSKGETNNHLSRKILAFKLAYNYTDPSPGSLSDKEKIAQLKEYINNKKDAIQVQLAKPKLNRYNLFANIADLLLGYENQKYKKLDKTKVEETIKQVQEQAPIQKYWLLNELRKLLMGKN